MIHEIKSLNACEVHILGEITDEMAKQATALLLSYRMQNPKSPVLMFGAAIGMFVF
jgi:hypothetical protein